MFTNFSMCLTLCGIGASQEKTALALPKAERDAWWTRDEFPICQRGRRERRWCKFDFSPVCQEGMQIRPSINKMVQHTPKRRPSKYKFVVRVSIHRAQTPFSHCARAALSKEEKRQTRKGVTWPPTCGRDNWDEGPCTLANSLHYCVRIDTMWPKCFEWTAIGKRLMSEPWKLRQTSILRNNRYTFILALSLKKCFPHVSRITQKIITFSVVMNF